MKHYPMRQDAPAYIAVRAWLIENRGSIGEIMAGTGYGLSTTEKALCSLRNAGDPAVNNALVRRRGAPSKASLNAEIRRQKAEAKAALVAEANAAAAEEKVAIVRAAIAARSPLEMAWAA